MKNTGFVFENETIAGTNRMDSRTTKVNGTFPNQMVSIC